MTIDLEPLIWRKDLLREGLTGFAIEAGFPLREVTLDPPTYDPLWLEDACSRLGLELEFGTTQVDELEENLRRVAPGAALFLADMAVLFLVSANEQSLSLFAPGGRIVVASRRKVAQALIARYAAHPPESPLAAAFPEAASALRRAVAARRNDAAPVAALASVRLATSMPAAAEIDALSLRRRGTLAIAASLAQSVFAALATYVLAAGSASGRIDRGQILGWALALVTVATSQGAFAWTIGQLNIDVSSLLKRRLLDGTFLLDSDKVKADGVGTSLSIASESATIDQLSVSDVLELVTAITTAATTLIILATFPQECVLFLAFVVVTGYVSARSFSALKRITEKRVKLTDLFIERILGHHTRVVQLPRARWHEGEDETLFAYANEAERLDRLQVLVQVLPRIWSFVAIAVAALRFAFGERLTGLVPLILGAYLGAQAVAQFARVAARASRWYVSYALLAPILARSVDEHNPLPRPNFRRSDDGETILTASGLRFAYHPQRPPILKGLDLEIRMGDRILVTGRSGGGKSTLAALLTALRQPTTGVVLLHGYDQHSVEASEWRRHVVSAPQFHENYIFQNTLAFNLLLGRSWPPEPPDLHAAETICRELGLGPLLDRMPAGLNQLVGETGWKLSHGERSRIYIARALLQRAEVVLFDESFGTLDPETLQQAMETVVRRAPTLLVIAHR